ncbi:MAG: response regulator [Deltaproteobacteria bacterium]|nr:response regulator [Candidatus Tharpella aukensis]
MLTDDQLAKILIENRLLSEKELRNARERQRNVENEGLEESLLFLGLADYAKLGKAYALHYELPYYPVFHQGLESNAGNRFPVKVVQSLLSLPIANDQKGQFSIVSCQPEDHICKGKIIQLAGKADIDWRVASRIEIEDAISRYYLKQQVKREKQEIEIPFDFKIIDFEINGARGKTKPGRGGQLSAESRPPSAGKRIILIEPDHKIRNAISTLLSHEGYRITAVIDEGEAIKELLQEDAVYILKRRVFHSQTRRLETVLKDYNRTAEIRYFGSLGGIMLGEELSPEELFRNYLATVKLIFNCLTRDNPEISRNCHRTAHYARLLATSLGLKRKNQEALLLAVYLKEIGLYDVCTDTSGENKILSLIPVLPYEKSAALLKKIEDSFKLSEIISQINQPAAKSSIEARIMTLLLWFINGPGSVGTDETNVITTEQFRQHLNQEPDDLIDRQLAEELLQIINHEQHLAGLTKNNGIILVLDPSFERDQGDLYARLIKESYEINFILTAEQARTHLEQQQVILIISEMGHENYNGIAFCNFVKKQYGDLPFIFFSAENREELVSGALLVGADDFISKESSTQVAFLKINRLIQRGHKIVSQTIDGGVSGSLDEMGFMETIQILANREKDALISLQDQENNSAEVYLHLGEITYAKCGELLGETAIYELLTWKNGFFQVTTPKRLPERNVFGSTEAMMLEGCRLMDESLRDLREVVNDDWQLINND